MSKHTPNRRDVIRKMGTIGGGSALVIGATGLSSADDDNRLSYENSAAIEADIQHLQNQPDPTEHPWLEKMAIDWLSLSSCPIPGKGNDVAYRISMKVDQTYDNLIDDGVSEIMCGLVGGTKVGNKVIGTLIGMSCGTIAGKVTNILQDWNEVTIAIWDAHGSWVAEPQMRMNMAHGYRIEPGEFPLSNYSPPNGWIFRGPHLPVTLERDYLRELE